MTIQNIKKKSKLNLEQNVKELLNITEQDLTVTLNVFNVSSKALNDIVQNIREWYEKQPHLPQGELHDEVIVRRLITQGFSIERVKEKIDNYYTIRHKMPEILCNRDPLSIPVDKCLKEGHWVCLPKKTPDNKRVTIFRYQSTDLLITDLIKVAFMIGDYRLWNDDMGGDYWIFDFKNASFQHALQLTPMLIKRIMFYLNYCFGPKVVAMYLVNLPPFASTIVSLFKKSMKSKMVERLYTLENFEDIFVILPKSIFPKDLGGEENLTCQEIADNWTKTFQNTHWRDYFIEQDSVGTDESKRQVPTKADELFGPVGSFKQLELD